MNWEHLNKHKLLNNVLVILVRIEVEMGLVSENTCEIIAALVDEKLDEWPVKRYAKNTRFRNYARGNLLTPWVWSTHSTTSRFLSLMFCFFFLFLSSLVQWAYAKVKVHSNAQPAITPEIWHVFAMYWIDPEWIRITYDFINNLNFLCKFSLEKFASNCPRIFEPRHFFIKGSGSWCGRHKII